MKKAVYSIFKTGFFVWIIIQSVTAHAVQKPVLEIHQNQKWQSVLKQWFYSKYSTELQSSLRFDLSIQDLVDQTNRIIKKEFSNTDYSQQLSMVIQNEDGTSDPVAHFDRWYTKLNEIAAADSVLKKQLDRQLLLQEYNADGVALTSNIPMLRLGRIRKIEKYNQIALDPEGSGILKRLGKSSRLTVLSAHELSKSEIKRASAEQYLEHYQEMFRLEAIDRQRFGGDTRYAPSLNVPRKIGKPMHVSIERDHSVTRIEDPRRRADERFFKQIFNALEKIPEKARFIRSIDEEMNHTLPRTIKGEPALTPSFLQEHESTLIPILKDLTWKKQLSEDDDQILYWFRKWIKQNRSAIQDKLAEYNNNHGTTYKLDWISKRGMPRRSDVIESYELLALIFEDKEPWQDEINTIMLNHRGKEITVGRTIVGGIIRRASIQLRNLVKYENISGVAAGTGAFLISGGNLALAMTANSVTHDLIANRKYDRDPKELLTQIPLDLLSGAITQSAVQPGRIFNVIALGAGSGFTQGVITRQDPLKSALVGATLETGLEFLPSNIRYPIVNGYSKDALRKNAVIEILTTSAKTGFVGGVVAVLEKKDVTKGIAKGAAFGATSAVFKIIVLGARYRPLHGQDPDVVQSTIDYENAYDNANGAPGGNYQITQETIKDTPYRAGGWLPVKIDASIALPGNVSMSDSSLNDIEIIVHEAHHLSQQEQLGLARFYFLYLMEATTVPYEDLSFEISPH